MSLYTDYQSSRRAELYGLLGVLPDREAPVTVTQTSREVLERNGQRILLERLVLHVETDADVMNEPIPAWYAVPEGTQPERKLPGVLFCHSHGGRYRLGKDELIEGNVYLAEEPHVWTLTREGYAVLAIDSWVFGERAVRKETAVFKDMLWRGETLWGHMVYDDIRALDVLSGMPEVDPARIAALGISMGSTRAWWLAALDERVKVCVDLCCQTDYDALAAENGFDRHGVYYYVPSLRRHFTTPEIDCLIAPRPHLATVGLLDDLTPVSGVDRIEREVSACYGSFGVPERFRVLRFPLPHQENDRMRADELAFLRKYL